jgi:GNAT superfamily N-acetyltransferase
VDFDLRPIEPTDGPGLDVLLRTEAQTTAFAISTRYRHDIVGSMLALHPTFFGVVATNPGMDGLVGMGTAFTDNVQVGDRVLPSAHLENLKVRHDVRRHGLGRRLAEWRIAEAARRLGDVRVTSTGIDATNVASLATARHWAGQVLGPLRVVIAKTKASPAAQHDIRIRPAETGDLEAVADGVNAFYREHTLYPPQTPEGLAATLEPTEPGGRLRHYRVAVTRDGAIVAGACVTQRFDLMTDHLERIPLPMALLGKILPIVPPGGVIRTIEVTLGWFTPGHEAAGNGLWRAIRSEWSDRATHAGAIVDPRGPLAGVFRVGPTLQPKVRLMVPVRSPVPVDEGRPVYLWR